MSALTMPGRVMILYVPGEGRSKAGVALDLGRVRKSGRMHGKEWMSVARFERATAVSNRLNEGCAVVSSRRV